MGRSLRQVSGSVDKPSAYVADPLTGIKIVYDKRIRVGVMRADKSGKFLRMNPKTKPSLDKAVYMESRKSDIDTSVFKRMYAPHVLNPPYIVNPSFTTEAGGSHGTTHD
jgi:hypothetical protein